MRDNLSSYYQACGVEVDAEMLEIDAMEDSIAPLDDNTVHIRGLSHGSRLVITRQTKRLRGLSRR